MQIKRQLFFKNLYRGHRCPRNAASADEDRFAQVFGTVVPHSIVESTSWWKKQSFELAAICDDAESGHPLCILLIIVFRVSSLCFFLEDIHAHMRTRTRALRSAWHSIALRHNAIDGDGTQQSTPVRYQSSSAAVKRTLRPATAR